MANVSLKTDFQNGDKLYDYELNNNFRAIKAALEAMNKITWQDNEEGVGVSAYKGNTEAIEARELIDGQLLYNTETGETYIDTYVDAALSRINTGSGNVVAIQPTEPTNEAVKLWIEEDTLDTLGTEVPLITNMICPIGKVEIFFDNEDHSNYLGFTWERIAQGRTLIGIDSTDSDFDTIGEFGGSKTHTLTVEEMPSHNHTFYYDTTSGETTGNRLAGRTINSSYGVSTGDTGGGQSHNIMNPYVVVAYWRRVS